MNFPIFFLDIKRVRRGYYEVTFQLIEENPKQTAEFEITEKITKHLEHLLITDPIPWFWAHKRWKHRNFIDFLNMTGKTYDSPGVAYSKDLNITLK